MVTIIAISTLIERKGAGGGLRLILNFRYQELFSEWKNFVLSQGYCIFQSRKNIKLHCAHEL